MEKEGFAVIGGHGDMSRFITFRSNFVRREDGTDEWGNYEITVNLDDIGFEHHTRNITSYDDGSTLYYIYALGMGRFRAEKAEFDRVRRLAVNTPQDKPQDDREPVDSNMDGLEV